MNDKLKNAFEAGIQKVIPAVLVYVQRENEVLMLHRNAEGSEKTDYHFGKWNGLGGKCEINESPLETACREVEEESGLVLPPSRFHPLGVIQFPNFKAHKNEDWIAFIFKAQIKKEESQNLSLQSPEGSLHWIPRQDLASLNLWPGDRCFIPYVIEERPFLGTIWYHGNEVIKHWIQTI